MAGRRLTNRKTGTHENLDQVPEQSGAYLIRRRSGTAKYAGKAGAGRLQERLKEHKRSGLLAPGDTFQYCPTASDREAKQLERKYRDMYDPTDNIRND
jgi:excinuclease UvrABC nuclease subunit